MPDDSSSALRAEYAAIEARLGTVATEAGRAALKMEIAALFRRVERQLSELAELKTDIGLLVEMWKALRPVPDPGAVSQPADTQRVHVDHLGASTLIEKGWSLLSVADHAAAERALLRALELSPDDPQAEVLLGWAQMLQEKYDEALAQFQKVLARQPTNALARTNLGYVCLRKRIFGEAIEHLSKAIQLDNDRKATLYAHFYLGLVYLEREMYRDAETFFRRALTLGPNLVEVYYEMGRAMWLEGRREQALHTWREGVAANRFSPWAERCREMLQHVEGGGAPSRAS